MQSNNYLETGVSVECIENFQINLLVPINMNELKHGNAEGDLFIERSLESIIRFELLGNISICEGIISLVKIISLLSLR